MVHAIHIDLSVWQLLLLGAGLLSLPMAVIAGLRSMMGENRRDGSREEGEPDWSIPSLPDGSGASVFHTWDVRYKIAALTVYCFLIASLNHWAPSLAALAFSASAQSPPSTVPGGPPPDSPERLPENISREEMWPAPTAEDWNRPCLIKWQRTWEDALAVSRETGKPILVCVNMDGEIASEHYAGIRYRDPEIAKLYEPYVCVIASV